MKKYTKIFIILAIAVLFSPHTSHAQSAAKMRNYIKEKINPPGMHIAPGTTPRADMSKDVPSILERIVKPSRIPGDDSFDQNVRKGLDPDGKVPKEHQVFLERINAALDRFAQLIERINSRVSAVKSNGGNTAVAEKHIAQAQVSITKVRTSVNVWFTQRTEKKKDSADTEAAARTRPIDIRMALQEIRTNLLLALEALKKDPRVREKTKLETSTDSSAAVTSDVTSDTATTETTQTIETTESN